MLVTRTRNIMNEKTHARAPGQPLVVWTSVLMHMRSYLRDLIRSPHAVQLLLEVYIRSCTILSPIRGQMLCLLILFHSNWKEYAHTCVLEANFLTHNALRWRICDLLASISAVLPQQWFDLLELNVDQMEPCNPIQNPLYRQIPGKVFWDNLIPIFMRKTITNPVPITYAKLDACSNQEVIQHFLLSFIVSQSQDRFTSSWFQGWRRKDGMGLL